MKLRLELENFLSERRFKLDAQKRARARLLAAHGRLTRVSVGGREFTVREGVVEVPEEFAPALMAQGWQKLIEENPAGAPSKRRAPSGKGQGQG